jgi:hypothetical protein
MFLPRAASDHNPPNSASPVAGIRYALSHLGRKCAFKERNLKKCDIRKEKRIIKLSRHYLQNCKESSRN